MNIKHDDFINAVVEVIKEDLTDINGNFNVACLLTIPGIWEVLSEEYNNEALRYLKERIEVEAIEADYLEAAKKGI